MNLQTIMREKSYWQKQKDWWFHSMILFPLCFFLIGSGWLLVFTAETVLKWIPVVLSLSLWLVSVAWSKIQKCSQKIAQLDQQIAAEIINIAQRKDK